MANTLESTLNKVGNAIEAVMGTTHPHTYNVNVNTVGQTCLERIGREARAEHLMRNEWRKDLGYSKVLVDAEYMIQTEFKVSSYEDRLKEQANEMAEKQAKQQKKNAEKQQAKKAKKAAKEAERNEKANVVNGDGKPTEPKETLYKQEYTLSQVENSMNAMRSQTLTVLKTK